MFLLLTLNMSLLPADISSYQNFLQSKQKISQNSSRKCSGSFDNNFLTTGFGATAWAKCFETCGKYLCTSSSFEVRYHLQILLSTLIEFKQIIQLLFPQKSSENQQVSNNPFHINILFLYPPPPPSLYAKLDLR